MPKAGVQIVEHVETGRSYKVLGRSVLRDGPLVEVWLQVEGWRGETLVLREQVTKDLGVFACAE